MQAILNEDYIDTVERLYRSGTKVDVVLTSPPYNTNKKQGKTRTLLNTEAGESQPWVRYDTVIDNMTKSDYSEFLRSFMDDMNLILRENGVVLLNLSYGNENTDGMWLALSQIIEGSEFTVVDCIVWKKRNAMPNNCSPNRLTRICEYVFVLVRKGEASSFRCNKRVKSLRKTGQKSYESITNFLEAANNDEKCPYNKATFSSDLVIKLLEIYAPDDGLVYDPFAGSGTTLVACKKVGLSAIGSEISDLQCAWAEERISRTAESRAAC